MSTVGPIQTNYNQSIEDRLQNTENLIKEMNAKFDDIASNKNSARRELHQLVNTLTIQTDESVNNNEKNNNNCTWILNEHSDTDSEMDNSEENNDVNENMNKQNSMDGSSSSSKESGHSSFNEETCKLNKNHLKKLLKSFALKERIAK
jgi:hypothetical protein